MREDLYKKWEERLRKIRDTAYLAELYHAPEKYYPGLSREEYEVIKEIVLDELQKRKWHFCPYHNVPLLFRTINGHAYFRCPVGGETYTIERGKLELTPIERIVPELEQWKPEKKPKKAEDVPLLLYDREFINSIIEDLAKFNIRIPKDISPTEFKKLLNKLRQDERLPKYIRDRISSYYWFL